MNKLALRVAALVCCAQTTFAAAVTITVDFTSAQYPPIANKFGLSQNWFQNNSSGILQDGMSGADAAGGGVVSGMVELDTASGLNGGSTSTTYPRDGNTGMFYRNPADHTQVLTRTDADLTTLRQNAATHNLVHFFQIAGVPDWTTGVGFPPPYDIVFKEDTTRFTFTGGYGLNKYVPPLEEESDQFGKTVAAFAERYTNQAGAGQPPTIWALWQEPSHTLGEKYLGLLQPWSFFVEKYDNFFIPFREEIYHLEPDAMVAGIQLNSNNGLADGESANPGTEFDGALFADSTADLLDLQDRKPIDFYSIQCFRSDQLTPTTGSPQTPRLFHNIMNSRVALHTSRWNTTSLLFNKFGWDNDGAGHNHVGNGNSLLDMPYILASAEMLLNAPDASYVLFGDFFDSDTVNPHRQIWYPLNLIGQMSPHRYNANVVGGGGTVHAVASADKDGFYILAWNTASTQTTAQFKVTNMSPLGLTYPYTALAKKMDVEGGVPATFGGTGNNGLYTISSASSSWTMINSVTLLPRAVVLIRPQNLPAANPGFTQAKYIRHRQWTDRGNVSAGPYALTAPPPQPAGCGFYDLRTYTLTGSVEGDAGAGVSGVVLKQVPTNFQLKIAMSKSGDHLSSGNKILGIRVDYINANTTTGGSPATLQTDYYRQSSYNNTWNPWAVVTPGPGGPSWWTVADPPHIFTNYDFFAATAPTLSLGSSGPSAWRSIADPKDRRIMVSLILKGSSYVGPATVTAKLTEVTP